MLALLFVLLFLCVYMCVYVCTYIPTLYVQLLFFRTFLCSLSFLVFFSLNQFPLKLNDNIAHRAEKENRE